MRLGRPERGLQRGLEHRAVHAPPSSSPTPRRPGTRRGQALGRRLVEPALEREDVALEPGRGGRGPAPTPAFGSCGRWTWRSTIPGSTTSGRRSIGGCSASAASSRHGPTDADPAAPVDVDPAVRLVARPARGQRRQDARPDRERRPRRQGRRHRSIVRGSDDGDGALDGEVVPQAPVDEHPDDVAVLEVGPIEGWRRAGGQAAEVDRRTRSQDGPGGRDAIRARPRPRWARWSGGAARCGRCRRARRARRPSP